MKRKSSIPEIPSSVVWMVLAVIVAVGAFFRLYQLGLSAFRADTILLWSLAQRQVPPAQVFSQWFEVSGAAGQMPMPAWIMQQFLELTGWKVTPFMVRLPFAVVGILTIPVAFFGGRRLGGTLAGLVMAALLAVNSFHIATSREAYFYSTLLLGYFLYFWAVWIITDDLWRKFTIGTGGLIILALGLFFSAYSQITGFILCGAGAILLFGLLFLRGWGTDHFRRNLWLLLAVHFVVLLPVAIASWGLRPLLSQIGASVEHGRKALAVTEGNLFTGIVDAVVVFGWGRLLYAWVLVALAAGGGIWALAADGDRRGLWIAFMVVVQVVLFAVVRAAAGAMYEARYFSGIMPFFLCILALGLVRLPELIPGFDVARAALIAAGLGFCIYPAWLQTQLIGKPTPYWDIVRWMDSNLPVNTPVLVDRWFEPWNELVSHPSTNVRFTFTVPNEPVDVFLQNRWRDSARAFLEKYPDAAYLEIAKTYWEAPGVGPWEWPRQYFAHNVTIANEPGLKLRHMGLANRGDYYSPTTNRVVVEIFYNTPEDVVARARAKGQSLLLLYAEGWDYAKPWQQTRDFRDWRVLEREAVLEAWNLTDQPVQAMLRVRGVAVPGSKRVRIIDEERMFAAGQWSAHEVRNMTLKPGSNRLVLRDPMAASDSVLLVSDLELIAERNK